MRVSDPTARKRSSTAAAPLRWAALLVIATAELLVVLDATIVTVALPRAERDLGLTDLTRPWVITAYTLAFGCLLLLGGRVVDRRGYRGAFVVGAAGFALASGLGGLATGAAALLVARALQGGFAAVLVPAALAGLTLLFVEERERATAFAVYGGIASGGSALGMVLGGVLTEYASWRWCLLVNVPVGLLAAAAAARLLPATAGVREAAYDVRGAVVAALGSLALVLACTRAAETGWAAPGTVALVVGGLALVALFVLVERRTAHPLLPLRIVADRDRATAFATGAVVSAGLVGALLFLAFYFQAVAGLTPLRTGLALLPVTGGSLVASAVAGRLLPSAGARPLMLAGTASSAAGLLWLSTLSSGTPFVAVALPAQLALGLGLGLAVVPLSDLALRGVAAADSGAAGAALNATQQVAASLGTAVFSTVATTATATSLSRTPAPEQLPALALLAGYQAVFRWAAAVVAVGFLVTWLGAGRGPRPATAGCGPASSRGPGSTC